jgi:hypothetical protein
MNTMNIRPRRLTDRLHRAAIGVAMALPSLLTAVAAHADVQALYEWHEPGGAVVFSQFPPDPGEGTAARTLVLHDLYGAERATALRVAVQSMPVADPAQRSLARADARVSTALAALQRAEHNLRTGQQPRSGERQHLVNGHSRLTSAYFNRISAMETAATKAHAELQAAYAARDALVP